MMIETDRLILREFKTSDLDALHKVIGDSENMKYYSQQFDREKVRLWIEKSIERYNIFGFGLWAVCLKEAGELIGDCGLTMQNINAFIRPEIGYHIRLDLQKKGYAKEAAKAVRDWVFKNTMFNAIFSYTTEDNIGSINTAISYGCSKVDEYIDEEGRKIVVYSITKDKWEELK